MILLLIVLIIIKRIGCLSWILLNREKSLGYWVWWGLNGHSSPLPSQGIRGSWSPSKDQRFKERAWMGGFRKPGFEVWFHHELWQLLTLQSLSFPICKIAMLILLDRHTLQSFVGPDEMVPVEGQDTLQNVLESVIIIFVLLQHWVQSTTKLRAWHLGSG